MKVLGLHVLTHKSLAAIMNDAREQQAKEDIQTIRKIEDACARRHDLDKIEIKQLLAENHALKTGAKR